MAILNDLKPLDCCHKEHHLRLVDVPDPLLLSVSIHSLSNTANMMIIVFYYFSSRERHGDYSKMIYDFKI